jgi:hypothetical protein
VLVGAALAFPVGMIVAGRGDGGSSANRPAPRADAPLRDVFSPAVRDDPWFVERQREGVEALERHCADSGELCREARAARSRLAELDAGR